MAPRGAPVHRRRRRGELRRHALPHRRHRRVPGPRGSGVRLRPPDGRARRGVAPAVAGTARRRPPDRTRPPRHPASRECRGRRGAIGAARPPRRRIGDPAPFSGASRAVDRRSRRHRHDSDGGLLSGRGRVGRARSLTRRDQQHAARGSGGPARPTGGTNRPGRFGRPGDPRQRANRRRHPRQRRHDGRHQRRPGTRGEGPARRPRHDQASADPPPGRCPTSGAHCCRWCPCCPSG